MTRLSPREAPVTPVTAVALDSRAVAAELAREFARTARERDRRGGTPKVERDQLRRSGLLRLTLPQACGGFERPFAEALDVVRSVARADGSLAHVLGFHYLMLATVRLFGTPDQWHSFASSASANAEFWGNALNPRDTRASIRAHGRGRVLEGTKSFCSGSGDSDMLIVGAHDEHGKLAVVAIPTSRTGVAVQNDWDAMGQRQTDSGSVEFREVLVSPAEVLNSPGPLGSTFATLRPCLAQLTLANVVLGIGEGALSEAKQAVRSRRGLAGSAASSADRASEDPYVIANFGELWLALESARLLCDRAGHALDEAFARGEALTEAQRGELALQIAAAKVASARAGLDVTSRIFESMGARAAAGPTAPDRYWRNVRTLTLHDSLDHKLRDLGNHALNDEIPAASFYS